jgi:tryptophanyl-tRNA synthetase
MEVFVAHERAEKDARVLSGVQPSGTLHLGNYFGAIRQHIELQEQYPGQCFYFVADFHALTTLREAAALRQNVWELTATYLALGLDPEKALMFRQSDVPEVTELTWLLSTVTGMGLLERAHSYKDKIASGIKPSVGLFTYPVLMAADILIYDSTLVPVGKDQVQHIEMAQDMATHFNETYGRAQKGKPLEMLLRRPEWKLSPAPYVPGLDGRKMSKSYENTIPIFSSDKKMKKTIGRIVTDSTPLGEPLSIKKCNVYALLELFCTPAELETVQGWYESGKRDGADFGYGHAKQYLTQKIQDHFAPARARLAELRRTPSRVEAVLAQSAARARAIARRTLDRCRRACGLA